MRIAVTSFGTEGDVRPYIALARGLRARGHDAFVVAARPFRARAESVGVPFRESRQRWDDAEIAALMTRVLATPNRVKQSKLLFAGAVETLHDAVDGVIEATADAEAIVSHNVDVCGYAAALTHRVPRIAGCLSAHTIPTGNTTPWGASLGRPLNRLISAIVRSTFASSTDAGFNALLARAKLPPQKGVVLRVTDEAKLTLAAVSPALVPPDPRWDERFCATGFWFLDDEPIVPPELSHFLAAHQDPPIVVSLGSMVGIDAAATTRVLIEGLAPLDRPVILQAGWAALGDIALPAHFFRASYLPHSWLLPQAACLLHHGGIGTVAAALRAGIPQIVTWLYADQPDWGKLLVRRGWAAGQSDLRKLSPAWLAATCRTAVTDEALRVRTAAVGATIREERGVERAVDRIEQTLARV